MNNGNYEVLTLAPHQRVPIINFGHVKADQKIQQLLVIKNPQRFQVKVNVTYKGASINDINNDKMTLVIEKNSSIDFKIKWSPVDPGNYKYIISFECTQSLRKMNVSCYGECSSSTFKKHVSARRPLGQLLSNGHKSLRSAFSYVNSKPAIATLGKEDKSSKNATKLSNALLFEVDPIHTCKYEETNKATSLPADQNNDEVKNKFLVESIYNRPIKRKYGQNIQKQKPQHFSICESNFSYNRTFSYDSDFSLIV